MKVVWSESARDDFDRMIAFVADRNPDAAARIVTRIDRVVRELGGLRTGRRGRVPGTYDKIVPACPTSSPTRSRRRGPRVRAS